jgi:hypothetical protein
VTVSDETLMAYLDNELSPEERARVAAIVASDPDAKARLARQERLHAVLSAAFNPVMEQPVPERLVAAAMTTPASLQWRVWQSLSRLFARDRLAPGFVPRYALAAATFVLGLGVAWLLMPGGTSYIGEGQGGLVAQGDLATALERQLASEAPAGGPHVGLTFRTAQGAICRTFETGAARANYAGIACRDAGTWKIAAVARAEPPAGAPYQVAGAALPPTLRAAVAAMIDGAPFDAEQERRARDTGW